MFSVEVFFSWQLRFFFNWLTRFMVCCSIQLVGLCLSRWSTWNFPLKTLLLNSPTVELLTLRKADLLLVLDCGSCGQKPYEEDEEVVAV